MKKSTQLIAQGFESSSGKTPEFLAFARTFKAEFMAGLKARGAKEFEFSVGHFYLSGFFTAPDGGLLYFSIDDVRWSKPGLLLIRTAKHRKDYTGGSNRTYTMAPDILERVDLQTVAFQQI